MNVPATIAAKQALLQQAVALSVVRQAADMQQKLAAMLAESVRNVPVSPARGGGVDLQA